MKIKVLAFRKSVAQYKVIRDWKQGKGQIFTTPTCYTNWAILRGDNGVPRLSALNEHGNWTPVNMMGLHGQNVAFNPGQMYQMCYLDGSTEFFIFELGDFRPYYAERYPSTGAPKQREAAVDRLTEYNRLITRIRRLESGTAKLRVACYSAIYKLLVHYHTDKSCPSVKGNLKDWVMRYYETTSQDRKLFVTMLRRFAWLNNVVIPKNQMDHSVYYGTFPIDGFSRTVNHAQTQFFRQYYPEGLETVGGSSWAPSVLF